MSFWSDLWHGFTDWLMPTPDSQGQTLSKTGTNQSIPVIYGAKRVGGIEVLKTSSDRSGGPWNDYLHLVILICEGEIEELGTVYFNGVSEHEIEVDEEWYHIERFTGADNQPVCQTLVDHNIGWTTTDLHSGIAYLYVRLRQDDDADKWRGVPEITVDVKGKKVKNLDTGVVEYSTVPPYCLADYLTRPRYGRGASEVAINVPSFVTAANKTLTTVGATENQNNFEINSIEDLIESWADVDWSEGYVQWDDLNLGSVLTTSTAQQSVSQPMMSCNVVLDTRNSCFDNVKTLLAGMRGIMPSNNGVLTLQIEDHNEPEFYFDSSNIIGGVKLSTKGRKDKSNQVTLSFSNKAIGGEDDQVVFPETGSSLHNTWLAEDYNVPLPFSITMLTINNKPEALQMAEVIARLARGLFTLDFTADDSTWVVEPGDIVAVTDSHHGFDEKPFRVMEISPSGNGKIKYKVVEHQPSIYPWVDRTYTQDYVKTNLGNPFDLFPPTGLTVNVINDTVNIKWFKSPDKNVGWYRLDITDEDNNSLVKSTTTRDDNYTFGNLGNGAYKVDLYAANSTGISNRMTAMFSVDLEVVVAPIVESDFTILRFIPDDPRVSGYANGIYFRYSTTDDFENASHAPYGSKLDILDAGQDVWFIWYGDGDVWYQVRVTNSVFTRIDIPALESAIGRSELNGEIDERIDDFELEINNQFAITNINVQQMGLDAVQAIAEQANKNILTQEYVDEIDGFRVEINETVGQILVEGGAVTAEQFNAVSVLVDTHNGQISTLVQQQDLLTATSALHTSQIDQTATDLSLLVTSIGTTDFNSLSIGLGNADNKIYSQSISLTAGGLSNIESILNAWETGEDLRQEKISLAIAQDSIQTLTTENEALAVKTTELGALAEQAVAGYQENTEALATETQARTTQEQLFQAALDTEASTREASIQTVSDAVVTETQARATQASQLQANIDTEASTRASSIQNVSTALVGETQARATQAVQLQANIDDKADDSALTAQISRIDDVIVLADDTAEAFSVTKGIVDSPTTGVSVTYTLAQQAKTTADNAATQSSVTVIENQINHPDSGLAAAFTELNVQSDAIDGIKATATFGVDINGNFTGVIVNGSSVSSSISLNAGEFSLYDPGINDYALEYLGGEWRFKGTIYADKVVGDTSIGNTAYLESTVFNSSSESSEKVLMEVEIDTQPFARTVFIPCPWFSSASPSVHSKLTVKWYKTVIGGAYSSASYTDGLVQGLYNYSSRPFSFFIPANQNAKIKITGQWASGGQVNMFQQIYKVESYRYSDQITFTHSQPV